MDLRGKKVFGSWRKEQKVQGRDNINELLDTYEEGIGVDYTAGDLTVRAYLVNAKPFKMKPEDAPKECAGLLMYFVDESGKWLKGVLLSEPYFFIRCKPEVAKDMMPFIHKYFADMVASVDFVRNKLDLSQTGHLSGQTQLYLKLNFKNVQDLVNTRNTLRPIVEANRLRDEREAGYYQDSARSAFDASENMLNYITEIREDDVLYHMRVMIDHDIRCAFWYNVTISGAYVRRMERLESKMDKGDLRIMAFDIETTKAPLKFPDPKIDSVMMISYMYEGQGYLIVNRSVVTADIEDFTYSPKAEYETSFTVYNVPDEKAVLDKFFSQLRDLRPTVISSYNGDVFDWPFIEERARSYQMQLEKCAGITVDKQCYLGRFTLHMDCLYWVERDAYLPQGSHGLKAVTKAKLGYNPVELDPEDILPYARTKPNELSVYSASDAVATYYLYKKMIHDFIFALCTIIPTFPDEVLRLGSGTLCEALLMAEAYRNNIIFPNKHKEQFEKFYEGHLLDTETYIGGHVEALRNGVYRSDIPVKFHVDPTTVRELIDKIDDVLRFVIEHEQKKKVEICTNYTTVRDQILEKLKALVDAGKSTVEALPKIYHVDVAAMYPNIILSNRLQPVAIVSDKICASCEYNDPSNNCKRPMGWTWRGDYFPLNRGEYEVMKRAIVTDRFQTKEGEKVFSELSPEDRGNLLKLRVKKYCERAYKKIHVSSTEVRKDTVCMRENPFYVDTVRAFRDRRYEYKNKVKVWKGKVEDAMKQGDRAKIEECENIMNLFESLQLAHKIILNSFYGYVMRRGARWYSMQMAGIVTHLGGNIITFNRQYLERIGIPLELDTDGIWCLFPQCFPENFTLEYSDGKKARFHYPCSVLNMNTYFAYANSQYQTYSKEKKQYATSTEMSVSFEVDGPYRCIVLPAAREEGKMLKKKYAVFNMSGKLQELKGFELKRRGELNIVKIFQSEVFSKFIEGKTLEECYHACAEVAERWYDLLESEGSMMSDVELIEYIGEDRRLAKSLSGYGKQKSVAITCAKRLAEFLGIDISRDKGFNTRLVIAKKPAGRPVTERAIPTAIFTADPAVCKKYLRSWLKDEHLQDCSMKANVDWEYYKERLAKTIQKIVTIPAVMQGLPNPFPKVAHPEWLKKRLKNPKEGQRKLDLFFTKALPHPQATTSLADIEDLSSPAVPMEDVAKSAPPAKPLGPEEAKHAAAVAMQDSVKNLAKDCPRPTDDFDGWLRRQKEIWKIERKLGAENIGKPGQAKGLISYLKMQEEVVGKSLWHVLEISELQSNPGYLKVWFVAEHEERTGAKVFNMFTMNLHMKRTFYINSRSVQAGNKQVKKTLPRSKPVYNLYEIEAEEEKFLENYANFGEFLSSPEIEGIYEANVPLSVRAILLLGSNIRPKKKKIVLNQSHIAQNFSVSDFEVQHTLNALYLPPNSFDKVLVSHSCKQLRHVWGVFLYGSKQMLIFCVHESIKQIERPNLARVVKLMLDENGKQYADWEILANYTATLQETAKAIEDALQVYKARVGKPVILVLQSPKSAEELIKMGIAGLSNDFPVLRAPMNDDDMNYPALNWQVFAAKNLAQRFVELEDWLGGRMNFAKMAGLPLCNIEPDAYRYVIDMLFAKKLYLSNYVLWYSSSGVPDLGSQSLFDPSLAYEEEIENTQIVHPGVYRGYCVELKLSLLAIDTILKSDVLSTLETGFATAAQEKDKVGTRYDPNDIFSVCMDTFSRLRAMVGSWMGEIQRGNVCADQLMHHVYRWLSSPSARMYDPALHRMIHVLMVKVFLRFIQRFKDHGAQIIYAGFNRLVIYTGKQGLEEAQNYVDFVCRTIQACDSGLYQHIFVEPTTYWRLLLFKDVHNYGGIQESQPNKIASSWNIGEYLPPAVEEILLSVIAQYIHKLYSFMRTHKDTEVPEEAQEDDKRPSMEDTRPAEAKDAAAGDMTDRVVLYMKKLVSAYFSQKLFTLLPDLIRRKEEEMYESDYSEDSAPAERSLDEADPRPADLITRPAGNTGTNLLTKKDKRRQKALERWEFPENLASHLTMTNPALEFVKFVMEVFSLEPELSDEVTVLRRNLLKMLKVGEYSQEAKFENPSLVFVLQDVICDFCLSIRDIDVCRDSAVTKGNWRCEACEHSYNKEYIENKLIEIVERRVLAYQMQDLRCDKCRMVKTNLLGKYCECTGRYRTTLGRTAGTTTNLLNFGSDVRMFVLLMKRIAVHHGLDLLRSVVDSIHDPFMLVE